MGWYFIGGICAGLDQAVRRLAGRIKTFVRAFRCN
jgi:hypothetical protein